MHLISRHINQTSSCTNASVNAVFLILLTIGNKNYACKLESSRALFDYLANVNKLKHNISTLPGNMSSDTLQGNVSSDTLLGNMSCKTLSSKGSCHTLPGNVLIHTFSG